MSESINDKTISYASGFLVGTVGSAALCAAIYKCSSILLRNKRLVFARQYKKELNKIVSEWVRVQRDTPSVYRCFHECVWDGWDERVVSIINSREKEVANLFLGEWKRRAMMELELTCVKIAGPECASWTLVQWQDWIKQNRPFCNGDHLIAHPFLCMWYRDGNSSRMLPDLIRRLRAGQDIEAEVRSLRECCDAALGRATAVSQLARRFCLTQAAEWRGNAQVDALSRVMAEMEKIVKVMESVLK